MRTEENDIMTLEQFKDKHYGKPGTVKRDEFDNGYQAFKLGAMIQEARLKKGFTQDELAIRVGTTKSYISKIENNIKEARISTLKKIIELGLGGELQLTIKF
jgi:ribosome-binding protein aMBF1 (putative translation factor)